MYNAHWSSSVLVCVCIIESIGGVLGKHNINILCMYIISFGPVWDKIRAYTLYLPCWLFFFSTVSLFVFFNSRTFSPSSSRARPRSKVAHVRKSSFTTVDKRSKRRFRRKKKNVWNRHLRARPLIDDYRCPVGRYLRYAKKNKLIRTRASKNLFPHGITQLVLRHERRERCALDSRAPENFPRSIL